MIIYLLREDILKGRGQKQRSPKSEGAKHSAASLTRVPLGWQ